MFQRVQVMYLHIRSIASFSTQALARIGAVRVTWFHNSNARLRPDRPRSRGFTEGVNKKGIGVNVKGTTNYAALYLSLRK